MAWTEVMRKPFRRKKKTNLFDLPSDIIINILLKLPLETLCRLRSVSKTLVNRLDDPLFVTTHTRLRTSTNAAGEVPRLMLVSRISGERMLDYIHMQSLKYDGQDLTAETKINAIALKNLPYWPWRNRRYDSQIYSLEFCYHGMFFYKKESERQSRLLLCDPLRGEILKLPTIDFPVQSKNVGCSYGMGFDSKTNTHKIVCVSSDIEGCKETQVLVLGTDSWKKIPSQPPCHISKKHICAYGDMHWLIDLLLQARDDRLRIVSFDFKKEEFYWTPHPTSVSMVDVPYMQLLNFRGSIAIACVSMEKYYINIWVLHNYDTKDWELDYSINLRMFSEPVGFSRLSSYSCGEWENGIFFIDKVKLTSFFFDLRRTSMKRIALPPKIFRGEDPWNQLNIVGYAAGSFVSLKDYGQLVSPEPRVENSRMQRPASFLQKLGQCFVGATTKIERENQQWHRFLI